MTYTVVPEQYRKSPPFVFSIDYFDYAEGVGYKKFYLAGAEDDSGAEYFITTDSTFISNYDFDNTGNTNVNRNFDITFNVPVTIAASNAIIQYPVKLGVGSTMTADWVISHVRGATVTVIGTGDGESVAGFGGDTFVTLANKIALTKTSFIKGDILRVNLVTTTTGATSRSVYYDPSGHISETDVDGGSWTSTLSVNIPLEVQE